MRRERRKNFRVEWNSPATVHHDKLTRPCILLNFSDGGARIAGIRADTIPNEFTLHITRGRAHKCRVLWRSDHTVGVEFIDHIANSDKPDNLSHSV
jgi:hypothetical protein